VYSMEKILQYGKPGAYNTRFIGRRLGYVRNYFSMRLRWASKSRMAFANAVISHG
jgi:hypothetical protein